MKVDPGRPGGWPVQEAKNNFPRPEFRASEAVWANINGGSAFAVEAPAPNGRNLDEIAPLLVDYPSHFKDTPQRGAFEKSGCGSVW
jgi:hypothetical protein